MHLNTRRSLVDGELALITRQARRDRAAAPRPRAPITLPALGSFFSRLTAALAMAGEPETNVWPQLRDYPYGTAA